MLSGVARLKSQVSIVLVAPRYGGNVGASARAMKTMGLQQLVLVAPHEHLTDEARWRSVHAEDVLTGARVTTTLTAAIADCVFVAGASARDRHLPLPAMTPRVAAAAIMAASARGPVALLFGNEASGLSEAELGRCHCQVRIPTVADYRSVNLAMAVQLLSYELRLAALDLGSDAAGSTLALPTTRGLRPLATSAALAQLLDHAERALVRIGFHDPHKPRLLLQRLRRLFGRARLEASEAHLLRGILVAVERAASTVPDADRPTGNRAADEEADEEADEADGDNDGVRDGDRPDGQRP